MVDYHKKYGCNKKGADRMKLLEKENVELAGIIRQIRKRVTRLWKICMAIDTVDNEYFEEVFRNE